MRLDLSIDHLVLEGFSPADGRAVGAALERELGRMIARDGAPAGLAQRPYVPHLDAGSLTIPSTARPAAVGRQLAAKVYSGLAGPGEKR